MFRGAEVRPFTTLPEGLVNLQQQVSKSSGPAYFFFYFDKIDALAHTYGPASAQTEAEITTFLFCMEQLLMQPLLKTARNTLLVVTADHGQIETDPQTAIYLNLEPRLKGLQRYLRTNQQGEILVPGGSPRDLFLYVKDIWLDHAVRFLSERLGDKAAIWKTQDLIDQGYFGPPPFSPFFQERVGNLVILPNAYESIWWYEKGKFEQKFYGYHGGLTPQEMEIPVCLYRFG
jgi:predicted AlkP superfamily pyrophosphatase or phosphodiesterase